MTNHDRVLLRYHADQRVSNKWISLALAIFSLVVFFNQETWASPIMFVIAIVLLWGYHSNTARRIRNGTFGTGTSCWSAIERADLARWLEHHGAIQVPGANLPG